MMETSANADFVTPLVVGVQDLLAVQAYLNIVQFVDRRIWYALSGSPDAGTEWSPTRRSGPWLSYGISSAPDGTDQLLLIS